MFKLESYITPVILSYVEKYVKNFKPEQSQVIIVIDKIILILVLEKFVSKTLYLLFVGILMGWRCIFSESWFAIRSIRGTTKSSL